MVRSKVLAYVLVGTLAATAVAGPSAVGAAAKWKHGQLADCPLAKLICGHVGRLLVLRSELNVTDEQKGQIAEVLQSRRAEILPKAKEVWEKRVALCDAVLAKKPNEAAIRKAAKELGEAIGDAAVLAADVHQDVAPVFSNEQRKLIHKCRQDCQEATETFFEKAVTSE